MSFKVLVEDDDGVKHVLHEIDDRRITRVGLTTRNGEAAGARIDHDMTEVLLTFEHVQNDGRPTIQDVEALQHPSMTGEQVQERIDKLAELPSATNSGLDHMLEAQRRKQEEQATDNSTTPEDIDDDGFDPAPSDDVDNSVVDNGPSEPSPAVNDDEGSTGDDDTGSAEFKLS